MSRCNQHKTELMSYFTFLFILSLGNLAYFILAAHPAGIAQSLRDKKRGHTDLSCREMLDS